MAYKTITHIDAENFTPAARCKAVFGYDRIVRSITVHHWGNKANYDYAGAFDDVTGYLASKNSRRVSSNYVVEAGKVACIVDPDDASWANGNARGNAQSVTIECNPRASKADRETVAELIANLREVYGDVPVHGHNYWTSTSCPGDYDVSELDRLAQSVTIQADAVKVIKPATKPKPKPKPRPVQQAVPKGIYWTVEPGDTLAEISQYYYGDTDKVGVLAKHNGISNPNVIHVGQYIRIPGPLTWTVERGDTVKEIADYYGISVEGLAYNTGLKDPNLIYPGQRLLVYP